MLLVRPAVRVCISECCQPQLEEHTIYGMHCLIASCCAAPATVNAEHAVNQIVEDATQCKFESTNNAQDEVVLLNIVQVCVASPNMSGVANPYKCGRLEPACMSCQCLCSGSQGSTTIQQIGRHRSWQWQWSLGLVFCCQMRRCARHSRWGSVNTVCTAAGQRTDRAGPGMFCSGGTTNTASAVANSFRVMPHACHLTGRLHVG
jgi:hypothetical protein